MIALWGAVFLPRLPPMKTPQRWTYQMCPSLTGVSSLAGVENLYDSNDAEAFEDIDAVDVKLDLANTYIEMGDPEGAREILNEIIGEADEAGQAKARAVLESM